MMKFELVLPCYNESRSLQFLIERARTAALKFGFKEGEFQLVMVENGSKDNSKEIFAVLQKQAQLSPWFRVVEVPVNQGYGYGLFQGLKATQAPIIGWSHADQQCDPVDAFKAYEKLTSLQNQNPGQKFLIKGLRSGRNWKDKIVSRVFELCALLILGLRVFEMNAQPKIFGRDLLTSMTRPPKTFAFDLYTLYCAQKESYKVETVPVLFPPRVHGLSNWSAFFFSRYKTIWGIIKYMFELLKTQGRA